MFGISYETDSGERKLVWQNSWGLTTRSIGVLIMVHGDDRGLVLPPRVAPIQAVIVYFHTSKTSDSDVQRLRQAAKDLGARLRTAGVRVEVDSRENYNPGWKFADWEQKGVPLRIELGPRDLEARQVVFARRDDLSPAGKRTVSWENVETEATDTLEKIQSSLLEKARKERDSRIRAVSTWGEFQAALDGNMVLAPWCERIECEEEVKRRTAPDTKEKKTAGEMPALSGSAKTLCLPFNQEPLPEDCKCFCCGEKATAFALWGRSY